MLAPFHNPRVGILWTDPLERQPDVPMPATYLGSTRTSRYPDADTFSIALYRPPPPAAMVEIDDGHDGGQIARLAVGELVLFDDANDDGRFALVGEEAEIAAPGTAFLGGSDSVVAYVARPFTGATAASFPLAGLDMTGYALLNIRCGGDDSRILKGVDNVLSRALNFVFQQSDTFPEVRPCLRTHSP